MVRNHLKAVAIFVSASSLFGLAAGCSEDAETASPELKQEARSAWLNAATASDADLAAAVKRMDDAVKSAPDFPVQATIDRLTRDDLAAVGVTATGSGDPKDAVGLITASEIGCPMATAERILVARNQKDLYPGLFDSYDRKYISSDADYLARKTTLLDWKADYTALAITTTFDASIAGKFRYAPTAGPSGGPVVVLRAFNTGAAKFHDSGDNHLDQNYEVIVLYEREPGKVIQLHALWRQIKIGALDLESETTQTFALGAMIDFDNQTGKVCKTGMPQPM